MSFSKSDLELIKSKILLSQEIEKKTKVIKKGKDSWCCCPFHDEKTPSCKINDDLGSYYCFGCGAKGDIFSLYTDLYNYTFLDAVKELSNKAGVDIKAGNDLVDKIRKDVASTFDKNVLGGIGSFSGFYSLPKGYKNPVLVACTDGVGTKVALAQKNSSLGTIGQDLVAMCVNDMVTSGAHPLFFLDYFASSKLNVTETATVIKSIAKACKKTNCSLIGGETAEMPNHYICLLYTSDAADE